MEAFFKLVNSNREPTCPEANEYLAEDRVMCYQIYQKKNAGFYLAYVPDAKAFTDAPERLLVLFKQRRRWMNGSFFAAWKVLLNSHNMVRCCATKHQWWQQLGLIFYMLYQFLNQCFTFTIIGSMYLSIKMAFVKYASQTIAYSAFFYNDPQMIDWFQNGGFESRFTIFYFSIVLFVLLISLGTDIG